MRRFLLAAVALSLTGCVSTQMKGLIGSPVQEAQIRYGEPSQVIEMPDGRRAYQFRSGGGSFVVPGSAVTTATVTGPTVVAQTTGTPAMIAHSDGCLLTFIARERGGAWVIEDTRTPSGLVC